jgi:shikimate kinase
VKRHVVLIGLPGSGKTVVGRLVAQQMKTRFVDVDGLIEETEAQTVAEIFERRGEQVFRELERSTVQALLRESPCVIAPGGGWAAQEHTLADAAAALLVYLETEPHEALQRVAQCGGRPLLSGKGVKQRMLELWAARRMFYKQADHAVETTGRSVEHVAQSVVALARSAGGW